jgi:hypothetical protein
MSLRCLTTATTAAAVARDLAAKERTRRGAENGAGRAGAMRVDRAAGERACRAAYDEADRAVLLTTPEAAP